MRALQSKRMVGDYAGVKEVKARISQLGPAFVPELRGARSVYVYIDYTIP